MKTPIDYILNLSKEEFKFLLSTYKEQKNKFNRNYIKKSDTNVDLEKLVTQGLLIPTFSKEYYMGPMAIEAMRVYNQMVYLYINYDKVEGNPVPPLDKVDLELIREALRFKGDLYSKNIRSERSLPYYNMVDKINKILNGRETDKEQPVQKERECSKFKGSYCVCNDFQRANQSFCE